MRPHGFRGVWREDEDARFVYAECASIHRIVPEAVAVPADIEDVQALVVWARRTHTPLVPRGSGSGMTGACLSERVVVDLSSLRADPTIDSSRQLAYCLPGTTRAAIEQAAEKAGLRFPVDPSSGAFCSIGGMVATNASGARTLKYGSTRHWVTGLDCVFADGSRDWVRRGDSASSSVPALSGFHALASQLRSRAAALPSLHVRKNSSGYGVAAFAETGDVVDLIVGSEGTLVVVVGVELALCEPPASTASLLLAYPTLDDAVHGATLARESGASACELLDRTFLDVARSRGALPLLGATSPEAILLVEMEARHRAWNEAPADAAAGLSARAHALESAALQSGAERVIVGLDAESEEALWALRHAASPILSRLDPRIASMQVIEDGVVPPERLADYVRGARSALDRAGIRGVIFGHAGDANVHVNALVDVRTAGWRARLEQLFNEVTGIVASLGGTPSGEHGDGRLRTPVLERYWSADARQLFSDIKSLFDPAGIFNPGVKTGEQGLPPWTAIKYDPEATPPTRHAALVLERVTRERAYDRSRLEMLGQAL